MTRKHKYWAVAAICMACIAASLAIFWRAKLTLASVKGGGQEAEIAFALSQSDLDKFSREALVGDCRAAHRVGVHHAFTSLQTDEAIKFLRLASKCSISNAKELLIAHLMHKPANDAEVDKLLLELNRIDPKAADGARVAVEHDRQARGEDSAVQAEGACRCYIQVPFAAMVMITYIPR